MSGDRGNQGLGNSSATTQYKDLLPAMAEKLDSEAFVRELCSRFRVLADPGRGLITSKSLRRNSGVLGMEGMSREGDPATHMVPTLITCVSAFSCQVEFFRGSRMLEFLSNELQNEKAFRSHVFKQTTWDAEQDRSHAEKAPLRPRTCTSTRVGSAGAHPLAGETF
ncbi:hypothetical protein H6P81_016814 [Aristolochia fimbriata]|uniref:Uncharacterized protein n=1 Tax=Aristolochia fimbriata TaxID=158543 RepID=A0AAV7E9T0_ARIFI|nr:hypothetical protein H6P81_016814 [Aristolochia fimbriata]